jgi:N-acetylglutamate synthase-like GNAT family acetyltransferase
MELTNGVISLIPVTSPEFPGFAEVKLLYYRAFQPDERREVSDLVAQLEKPDFKLLIIQMYEMPAGLIALWQLNNFMFIEHIAVTEQFRNRKIGETALKMIADSLEQPVLLETVFPTENISESRLAFYERIGFDIIDNNYEQPAYSPEKNSKKMLLLSNRAIMPDPIEKIVTEIHKVVYAQ